jgi:RimJ/RimL family protein N-acetyltransferase
VAVIDEDNIASRRVLEKSGLSFQGIRRAYACDCPGFSITRVEWAVQYDAVLTKGSK